MVDKISSSRLEKRYKKRRELNEIIAVPGWWHAALIKGEICSDWLENEISEGKLLRQDLICRHG